LAKKLHILFLSSWYPTRVSPTRGDFVQRHAEAVATLHKVTVVHIISDKSLRGKIEFSEFKKNKITTKIIYIPYTKNRIFKFILFFKTYIKTIKKIVTENVAMEEPKEFENCNVYNMAKLFLEGENLIALQNRYKAGGEGHGHFKVYLAEIMWEYFKEFRDKRRYYENNQDEVREILNNGAKKAIEVALPTIEKIRSATGILY